MLVHHAMALSLSPEQMKAWSLNLGHDHVLTTFTSYGAMTANQQGKLIQATSRGGTAKADMDNDELMAALAVKLAKVA